MGRGTLLLLPHTLLLPPDPDTKNKGLKITQPLGSVGSTHTGPIALGARGGVHAAAAAPRRAFKCEGDAPAGTTAVLQCCMRARSGAPTTLDVCGCEKQAGSVRGGEGASAKLPLPPV